MNIARTALLSAMLLLATSVMAQQQAEQTFPEDKAKAVVVSATASSDATPAVRKPHEKASVAFQRHVDDAKLHLQHAKQHLKDAKQRLKDANAPAKKPTPAKEDQ
jgi:hypothetical protein